MQHATSVLDIGTRFGDHDLQAFGLMCQGMANIAQARVDVGMSLIDEATVAAIGGRAHAARDRHRLLLHDRRVHGSRGLPARRRVDRGHDAMVRAAVDQWIPRALPGAPGRDHAPARVRSPTPRSRRGPRSAGADGLRRGAGRGRRVPRDRGDPAEDRRPRRRRGGVRAGASTRERCAARTGAVAAGPRAHGGGPLLDPRRSRRAAPGDGTGSSAPRRGRDRRRRHTTWRRHGKPPRSCASIADDYGAAPWRAAARQAHGNGPRLRGRSPKRRSASCARRSGSGPSPTCRSRPHRPACGSPPRTARMATRPRPCWSCGRPTRSSSSSARASTRRAAMRRSRRRSPRPAVASGARSCSPTSWGRRTCSRRSATRPGRTSCAGTTRRSSR